MPQAAALAGRASEHLQGLGFDLVGVEGAARDAKGVTGRGQAVLVEETKNFNEAFQGVAQYLWASCPKDAPKLPQSRYPVKPPDAVPNVVDLHGTPLGSPECQRYLSLCMTHVGSGGAPLVTVEVQDNGPGVPLEQQSVIFEKFRQGGDALERPPGTGLGLPISRRIIEHFGGRLWLRSAPGQGACFGFDLPRRRHAPTEAPDPPHPPAQETHS